MFEFNKNGLSNREQAEAAVLKWRSLALDLELLLAGQMPDPTLLTRAPLIERWEVFPKQLPALRGIVVRHPLAAESLTAMVTSPIVVAGNKFGWVRTESRYYRLGTQDNGIGLL